MRLTLIDRLARRLRAAWRSEGGFTLIELLMTVAIMGVIIVALTGVVISYFKTSVSARARMTESLSVQFAAAYWQRDVASIGIRQFDATAKTYPAQQSVDVAPACALPAGTVVTTLGWSEYDPTDLDSTATPGTVTVSYLAQADGATFRLVRARCNGATLASSIKVADTLTAVPTRSCDVACTGSGNALPTAVDLDLSVLDPEGNGTSAYTVTLSGERRQS